jgi:predicted alpha/beta superfamily hydrolase
MPVLSANFIGRFTMLNKLIIFLLFSFFLFGNTFSQVGENNSTLPEVEIAGTQLTHIRSDITGEDYDLYINLPRDYQDTAKIFPVIYLIDAQWDFPLVSAVFGEQYYDGFLPPAVVVGITWSGKNPDYDSLRARDFTPTSAGQPAKYGNAADFLKSIKIEIIPFVEKNYRVSPNDRTLMGSSFGGLFTLYTLFNDTTVFGRYVLTSPAILFDKGVINKYEKEFSEKHSKLPVRLYIAIGSYEDEVLLKKFVDKIKGRHYERLKLQYDIIENKGHSGAKAEGYSRGLQFAFSRPYIKLTPQILEQYTGIYQYDPKNKIQLVIENNHLTFTNPDDRKFVLWAETPQDFFSKGFYGIVHFKKDGKGKATGFDFEQYTGKTFITKVGH